MLGLAEIVKFYFKSICLFGIDFSITGLFITTLFRVPFGTLANAFNCVSFYPLVALILAVDDKTGCLAVYGLVANPIFYFIEPATSFLSLLVYSAWMAATWVLTCLSISS